MMYRSFRAHVSPSRTSIFLLFPICEIYSKCFSFEISKDTLSVKTIFLQKNSRIRLYLGVHDAARVLDTIRRVYDWWLRWRSSCFYTMNPQGETARRERSGGQPGLPPKRGEKKPKPGPVSRGSPKNSHPRDSSRRSQASLAQMHHLARVEIH